MRNLQLILAVATIWAWIIEAQIFPYGTHNYSIQAQPDISPILYSPFHYAFPDCTKGPLSGKTICNKSASALDRATNLISLFTLQELINNTGSTAPGVSRLDLPPYQVWQESLHGLLLANFTPSGDYKWATSFPMPILTTASLNRTLIHQIADQISTQARAFNNAGRYGLDAYAPNINAFRSPIWGRGQETPGEDLYVASEYAYNYITGLQGGVEPQTLKIVSTPKHFAGYDLENYANHSRLGYNAIISQQDLAEFYTPQFLTSVRDAKANAVMCAYNAVNGVPSCTNTFLMQTLLRDTWKLDDRNGYISTDCDSAYNVYDPQMYASNLSIAAADSIRAGADIDCGLTYQDHLNVSIEAREVDRTEIETAVIRLYSNLVRLGYFDGPSSPYRALGWKDVLSTDAQNISYEAAVEGITLLKNDGTLPLSKSIKSIALIGPWANATVQMQGDYAGTPPYLISPLAAAQSSSLKVHYAFGTKISSETTGGFAEAIKAGKASDIIIFAGGIDNTVEFESSDRLTLTWPGNQLDLISQLAKIGKPVVVFQMGGGQVDSSSLKANKNINSLLWGGYPGQSGGQAILDILTGVRSPAGRLVSTQYPAAYLNQFSQDDMSVRPDKKGNPGQTYKWYTGTPVYPFGHGLFYTTFGISAKSPAATDASKSPSTFNIKTITSAPHPAYEYTDLVPFYTYTVTVKNTGKVASDYSAILYANSSTAGPAPYPVKWVVGFDRLKAIAPGASATLTIPITIGSLLRYDTTGRGLLYPGKYDLALNNERSAVSQLTLTGQAVEVRSWPKEEQLVGPS